MYFIDGDKRVDMNGALVNGNVVFETNHFSTYVVVFEDAPSEDDGGEFPLTIAIGAIAVIALIIGAVVFLKRR